MLCVYIVYTQLDMHIPCMLKRKMQIPGQSLLIVTCGPSLRCPDDNDSVDDYIYPIQQYKMLKVTPISIVFSHCTEYVIQYQ